VQRLTPALSRQVAPDLLQFIIYLLDSPLLVVGGLRTGRWRSSEQAPVLERGEPGLCYFSAS